MIPCGLSSSLPFQRRAKACFCDARSIFMSLPDGSGTAAVPDGTKAVTAYLCAGSNAQALRGAAPVSDHKHRHRISVRTDSRRSSCGCRGELTEVRAERNVQRAADRRPCSQALHRAKTCWLGMCGRRRCISIQQADLTKPDGKFAIFRQAMCARAAVFLYSKRGSRCMAENFYQLALRTPGIWPLYASSRKQIRQMP